MSALIGSTGFVGGQLQKNFNFTHKFNRANIFEIQGLNTDLLVCAGLPAEKWKANSDPESDWSNMANLAQLLSTVRAKRAILVSTIDVYQPAINVTEENPVSFNGEAAYGRNRAWFEAFFTSNFVNSSVLRLPGLFGPGLKKNFVYDLLNNQSDQIAKIGKGSHFQFFDITKIWEIINICNGSGISLINVATEPVPAAELAEIFDYKLHNNAIDVFYNMQSIHCKKFGGDRGYLQSKDDVILGIFNLRRLGC